MKYNISHKANGVYQTLLVEASSERIAEAYFKEKKPGSEFLGIHEATRDDMKPGKPVMVVPDGYGKAVQGLGSRGPGPGKESLRDDLNGGLRREDSERMLKIKEHQRAFNAKMKVLELLGMRSGGWDEKTDKTAIVRPGRREIDSAIVGYMDRNLNIEWETKVLSIGRVDGDLAGVVFVEGKEYLFDYDLQENKSHVYGWGKGEQEKKSLPEVLVRNMDGIKRAISGAVEEFLSIEALKKEHGMAVDALIAKAEEKKVPAKEHREGTRDNRFDTPNI